MARSRFDGLGSHQYRNRKDVTSIARDNQISRETHSLQIERSEQDICSKSRMGERLCYNPFTKSYESPFRSISSEVRNRAKETTGRSIEESYEDFLMALYDSSTRPPKVPFGLGKQRMRQFKVL